MPHRAHAASAARLPVSRALVAGASKKSVTVRHAIHQERVLRPYQGVAVSRALAQLGPGRAVLLVAPTGAGKTVMAAEVAAHFQSPLIVAHRRELLRQSIGAAHWAVCGVVGAVRKGPDNVDLLVIDEAHRAAAGTYRQLLSKYPGAAVLGLTATPERTDGRGLGDVFQDLVESCSVRDLINGGHLVEYAAYEAPDEALKRLRELRQRSGDFDAGELGALMNQPKLVGRVVDEYLRRARGRRAIVFAVNIAHSKALADEFLSRGVRAAHLDGQTAYKQRDGVLGALGRGEIDVVCNVSLFTEGWDCPSVSTVVMARPTASLGLYLQCVGRGLRPDPLNGKDRLIILDHAGNIDRHGTPDTPRVWSLEGRRKSKERERADRQAALLKERGFNSMEEYELEQKRISDSTYSFAQARGLLSIWGASHLLRMDRSGIPSAGRGKRSRYPKASIDALVADLESRHERFYKAADAARVLGLDVSNLSRLVRDNPAYDQWPNGWYPKDEIDRLAGSRKTVDVDSFFSECLVEDAEAFVSVTDLAALYRGRGFKSVKRVRALRLHEYLLARGFKQGRSRRVDGKQIRSWEGLRLKLGSAQ
jgi:DNA repair protein RadD